MTARSATKIAASPALAHSLGKQVEKRIAKAVRRQPGRVFTPADFLDLGSPHAVGMVLSRMVRAGRLQRPGRGLYVVPRTHPLLGELRPSTDELAKAIARRSGVVVRPMDVAATNMLGLSEQVVAKPIYETNGPSRKITVAGTVIEFRHRSPRRVTSAAESSTLVFAALRGLGRQHVTFQRVAHLRQMLPAKERGQLLNDLTVAPAWMHPFLRYIADGHAPQATHTRKKGS